MMEAIAGMHPNQDRDQSLAKHRPIAGTLLITTTISICIPRSPEILMHFHGHCHTRQRAPVHFVERKSSICTILT